MLIWKSWYLKLNPTFEFWDLVPQTYFNKNFTEIIKKIPNTKNFVPKTNVITKITETCEIKIVIT